MTSPKVSSEDLMRLLQGRTSSEEAECLHMAISSDANLAAEYRELSEVARELDILMAENAVPDESIADRVLHDLPAFTPAANRFRAPLYTALGAVSLSALALIVANGGPEELTKLEEPTKMISPSGGWQGTTKYNDARIVNAVSALDSYLEGTFGALVMAAAGLSAVVSLITWTATKKKVHLWWCAIMVSISVAAFLLRSVLSTFFNDL